MAKKYNAVDVFNKDVSQSFVKGAAILTISMIIVKVFGLLDKIILERIFSTFGENFTSMGMGLYSNAYELFAVIFTVATGGLPIAISRLVSQNMTERRYKDVKQIQKISVPFFAIVGFVCFAIIVGAAVPYTYFLIQSPYAVYAMICLAPTVFFGCVASIYRGYFEGQRNMFPTAVSEIIEAVIKLTIGALLAYLILAMGIDSYHNTGGFLWFKFRDRAEAENTILAFSVAGAIMGISLGSMCSFLYYYFKFKIQGDGIPREYYESSIDARAKRETFMTIVRTAVPIAMGTLVMSLGSLLDQIIIQRVLLGLAENPKSRDVLFAQYGQYYPKEAFFRHPITIHTRLLGCYSTALTLMQVVTAVTQAFGSSAMPNVTSSWTKGDKRELKRSIETVLKMTMMFTLPMSFGLCMLAHPIMGFIYSSKAIIDIGGNVLSVMGITTIFTAAITPICSMINGIGKVKIPMILYTICMLVKIGTSWIFVSIPEINIQGATAGSMVAYGLICIVGMYLLVKHSKIVPDFFGTTIKPLIGAVCSSAAAYFVNMLISPVIPQRIATVIAIVAAVIVYLAVLLILRTFSASEVKLLPKGEKIAKTLEKLRLIS